MQIPIKFAKPGELAEWYLIELQGKLKVTEFESFDLKSIGNLFFTNQGEPILIIGHHELRGKEMKLDKPILILHKKSIDTNLEHLDDDENHLSRSNQFIYQIDAIAKKKILFKTRPKALISNTIIKNAKAKLQDEQPIMELS